MIITFMIIAIMINYLNKNSSINYHLIIIKLIIKFMDLEQTFTIKVLNINFIITWCSFNFINHFLYS